MAKATITLASSNGDSVIVSGPGDAWLADEIILDVDPQSVYDVGFSVRTESGAFEFGGRITGLEVPVRKPVLPFWLNPESRKRFQKMWGSPGFFRTVKMTWDGPSGPRFLMLRLSKEIVYTTEDGHDADIEKVYHCVVVPVALNPMFEGTEDAAAWTNPDERFSVVIDATSGTFRVGWKPAGGSVAYTGDLAYNISNADLKLAVEALPGVGAGKTTITGPVGQYQIVFNSALSGVLTTDPAKLRKLAGLAVGSANVSYAPNTGYFNLWNPTDQMEWLEWVFDPAESWSWPDYSFGQELKWNRPAGADAARMIVSGPLTQILSVMSDPLQDTYVNADLSNAAGQFNGVEPRYGIPPYTASVSSPVVVPVICRGPKGAKATLRQRRFWSAESGLE